MANFLQEELEKLYDRLKEFPEKGVITATETISDGEVSITYAPTKAEWTALQGDTLNKLWQSDSAVSEWKFIVDLYDELGIAPETIIVDENQYEIVAEQFSSKNRWYQNTNAHLSKDGKFYVVPVVYEHMMSNPGLQPFISEPSGKLNISELLGNLTDESKTFLKAAKRWALDKAASDLVKAINFEHKTQSETMAVLPAGANTAEAWYIDPRPPEYQNLFLKILFPRAWIDALPPRVDPCINFGGTTRTVILTAKTLKKDLSDLQGILNHFGYQMNRTQVHVDFDSECVAGKVSKVAELLNNVLKLNEKPGLSETPNGALQVGFTEAMNLEYIAYSETPDCLCDELNINAYTLKKGVNKLKNTPPFDSPTVNNLLFYLPEIVRKYSSTLNGKKSSMLFAAEESWLNFVKSFVFPKPEIDYDTSETEAEFWTKKIQAIGDLTNSIGSVTKNLLYAKDPTVLMAPDVRRRLLGMANAEVIYAGDQVMMDALTSELLSITAVYDNLLNKVPITELIKLALTALVKCVPDDDLKKKMCDMILRTMPGSEIKTKLIPCLRASGHEDAITHLESLILTRRSLVYRQAQARAPAKFKKTAADAIKSELDMAAVNEFYCSDPEFQELLGRPADDFSEEMLLAREQDKDDAICECILSVYGPVQQIFGFIEDIKDTTSDIVDIFGTNKAQSIEQQSSIALDRLLQPFYTSGRRTLAGFAESIILAIWQVIAQIVLAAILIILNHVKNTVLGSLATDICAAPANPFSEKNITKMIQKSAVYKDEDFNKLKKDLNKIKKLAGLSGEINAIIEAIGEIGKGFSPTEFKRIFTTPCHDNSADELYKTIKLPVGTAATPTYGGATQAAVNAATKTPGDASSCNMEDTPPVSIDAIHTFLAGVGALVDPVFFEDIVDEWEDAKAELINFCDPESINVFVETLDPEDIAKLAQKNQEDLIGDIVSMLPLLDPDKIIDMMPPLTCGPCNPRQVGQKPLMAQQAPGPILDTFNRLNSNTFDAVNKLFNSTVATYKPILLGVSDAQISFTENYITQASANMPDEGKYINMVEAQNEMTKSLYKNVEDNVQGKSKVVGKNLANVLETALAKDTVVVDPETEVTAFVYPVPAEYQVPEKEVLLIFNMYQNAYTFDNIPIGAEQVKIIVRVKQSKEILYQWPTEHTLYEDADAFVNFEDQLPDKITDTLTSILKSKIDVTFGADTYDHYWIDIVQLIFESIITESTNHDLFNGIIFNKIPLTDQEAKETCSAEVGATPLLNIEDLRQNVDNTRKALECVISRFDTPNSLEVATMYGYYQLLFKVCVVEEYLKNIFFFAFMRIGDILQSEAYLNILLDSVINSAKSIIGQQSYENLLEYSSKIINGRQQLGEEFSNPPGSTAPKKEVEGPLGSTPILKTPEDCLKILILESVTEISDILDNRIQSIVDPEWQKSFTPFGEDVNMLTNYAILSAPQYWSPDIYPYNWEGEKGGTNPFAGLSPMRLSRHGHLQFSGDKPSNGDFKNVNDFFANTGWPSVGPAGDKLPWSGGLFYQPYVKIESQALDKEEFRTKLRAAYDTWKHSDAATGYFTGISAKEPSAANEARDFLEKVFAEDAGNIFEKFFKLFFDPSVEVKGFQKDLFSRVASSHISGYGSSPDNTFYWSDQAKGSKYADRSNWANRGVISTDLIWGAPTSTNAASTVVKNDKALIDGMYKSTIDMFGFAKEVDVKQLGKDPGVYYDPELGEFNSPARAVADYIQNKYDAFFNFGDNNIDGNPMYNIEPAAAVKLMELLRDIIFNSEYTLFFDIKVGMRLNLLFRKNNDDAIGAETADMSSEDFNSYNEQKSFLWQKNDQETYYCFPLAEIEENPKSLFSTTIEGYANTWVDNEIGPTKVDDVPTLWAVSRALSYNLGKRKKHTLGILKHKLNKKNAGGTEDNLVKSLFANRLHFDKITIVAAFLHRTYMESAYPSIGVLFRPLKSTIQRYLAATTAAINDDYQYIDALAAETDPLEQLKEAGPDFAQLAKKFFMMCVQMAANTVDPTWKTQWFMPGPLTPVGIIAKTLSSVYEDDTNPPTKDLFGDSDACAPPDYETLVKGDMGAFEEATATSYPLTPGEQAEADAAALLAKYLAEKAAADKAAADVAANEEMWANSVNWWHIHFSYNHSAISKGTPPDFYKQLHGKTLEITFYSHLPADIAGAPAGVLEWKYKATFDQDTHWNKSTDSTIGFDMIGLGFKSNPGDAGEAKDNGKNIAQGLSCAIGISLKKFLEKANAQTAGWAAAYADDDFFDKDDWDFALNVKISAPSVVHAADPGQQNSIEIEGPMSAPKGTFMNPDVIPWVMRDNKCKAGACQE